MNQAIAAALADEMHADPDVLLMGEDVAGAGGIFKTSEGLLDEFGPDRVRDTPISEMGFLGAAVGAAATGLRPVVEIMFIEFLGVALDQLATEAAKFHYLSGGQYSVPLVVRASVGGGLGFGAQHSQTLETWMYATPGLYLAIASGPRSAYGLTRAGIRNDNPVVILEPRALYGTRSEVKRGEDGVVPLGVAERTREGTSATVVSVGRMVGTSNEAIDASSVSADVFDLRSLIPWDRDQILSSVERTGRLVIVEESPKAGGWGTEIAAAVSSEVFSNLKAPVLRITAPDAPVPFSKPLEQRFYPSAPYVAQQIDHIVSTDKLPQEWWNERSQV